MAKGHRKSAGNHIDGLFRPLSSGLQTEGVASYSAFIFLRHLESLFLARNPNKAPQKLRKAPLRAVYLELNISIPLTLFLVWHLTDKREKGFGGLVCSQEGVEEGKTFDHLCVCVLVLCHHLYARHAEANLSGIWLVSETKIALLLEESSSRWSLPNTVEMLRGGYQHPFTDNGFMTTL